MAKFYRSSHLLTCTLVFAIWARLGNADGFTHHEALDEAGKYNLFWKFDEEKIEFEAQVQTTGWVGLGLSPNGGMSGSDIVIGWVKDGKAHLTDRYADANAQPAMDESQDWELVSGNENGTHTVLRFNRKLITCDTKDRVINKDTMRLIWAFLDQDPEEDSGENGPWYHSSNRGVRSSILITQAVPQTSLPDTTYTFDLTMKNVSIPSNWHTVYWCRLFKLPTLSRKHHIVKMVPVITPGNEGLVHHLLAYKCKRNPDTIVPDDHQGHNCYTHNMPGDWRECYEGSLIAAWAIGSGDITFPAHVGYPIGGDEDDSGYVLMEMHYDNPQVLPGLYDSSGLRFIYTPELRDNDIGIMEVGMRVGRGHVIPPGANSFISAAFCDPRCLSQYLEELGQPIKIFANVLHSHLLGVQLNLRLIRDGVETDISRDDNYDFNLQFVRQLQEEITVYPGDTLVMECNYRSAHKDNVVYGGLGTPEEMCMDFLFYYPKFNLHNCDSRPSFDRTISFAGVESYTPDPFQVLAPPSLVNKSYEEVMEGVRWTDERAQQFSSYLLDGNFSTFCFGNSNSSAGNFLAPVGEMPFPAGPGYLLLTPAAGLPPSPTARTSLHFTSGPLPFWRCRV
ncbi:MOXD1 [Branchiostoma lanceolatum]|uniref:MOXD1 protein n=1 Tax=Branchiostoma lanceolatum TaxID=7740 RepID=A0A8K0F0B3_BRALA|nr:MOXD1 [Branchiostoma lanceolatum]